MNIITNGTTRNFALLVFCLSTTHIDRKVFALSEFDTYVNLKITIRNLKTQRNAIEFFFYFFIVFEIRQDAFITEFYAINMQHVIVYREFLKYYIT